MPINPEVVKRLAAMETRLRAVELRIGEAKALAKLGDTLIDIEGEWALHQIVQIMTTLAPMHANNPNDAPEIREAASQAIDLLQGLGFMPR